MDTLLALEIERLSGQKHWMHDSTSMISIDSVAIRYEFSKTLSESTVDLPRKHHNSKLRSSMALFRMEFYAVMYVSLTSTEDYLKSFLTIQV
jgi:hypothetical protein